MLKQSNHHTFWQKWNFLLPLFILGIGALLRLIYLGSMPGGMHQDETFVAWNAYALYHDGMDSAGHHYPVYMADWGDGHSALYSYLLLPLIALNGGNMNSFISRLPQAVIAILTLAAVYFLMKKMFSRQMGLWAMFLLAVCPWHITMSRWGLDANLAPGFLIFGLCFFICGLEDNRFLLLSAFLYGLSLYSYAIIWPIVPIMLALQIFYCLFMKKLRINIWGILSAVILFIMALPLLLFVLVNSSILPQIELPFMTIPAMPGYRGGELALSLSGMLENLRRVAILLVRQDLGSPYDILLPYGLFYDIGRIFIIIGFISLVFHMIKKLRNKSFSYEVFLFIQLIGAGIVCLLVTAMLHQVNCLFIPLVLCEAYGIWSILSFLGSRLPHLRRTVAVVLTGIYIICLAAFQYAYYTSYRDTVDAYFAKGVKEAVEFAMENGDDIVIEKGAQWPRILLFSGTTASEYLENVVYDEYPAPAGFTKGDITFHTRINYDDIKPDSVYIIYYTDIGLFEENYELTQFGTYWYVAVPVSD